MPGLGTWKKKITDTDESVPHQQLELTVKSRLAQASGSAFFRHRDPVYHIGESFRQSFALLGSRPPGHSMYDTVMEDTPKRSDTADKDRQAVGSDALSERERETAKSRFYENTSMHNVFAPKPGQNDFLRRFSETAFNRGTLSGAIMRGTGRMMLISCLKRTIGQSQPHNFRQRMLFENASAKRNVKGRPPDQVMLNKGDLDSAIGLTVDVLRNARSMVDSLTELMENGVEDKLSGTGTLQKMYPFLSDARERKLLARYQKLLPCFTDAEEASRKQVIQRAIAKTRAVIDKKSQMRNAFIHHLRALSDRAAVALRVFEEDEFRESAYRLLVAQELPPEEPANENDPPENEDK